MPGISGIFWVDSYIEIGQNGKKWCKVVKKIPLQAGKNVSWALSD